MNVQIKSQRSMLFVTLAFISISYVWGMFFQAPTPIKMVFSGLTWLSIIVFPFSLLRDNDFSDKANFMLKCLLSLSAIAIVRSVFNTDADMYAFGDKWITLFFNEYTTLLLIPPLFIYLSAIPQTMVIAKRYTWILMIVGLSYIITQNSCAAFLIIFLAAFYEYASKSFKIMIYFTIIISVLASFLGENPTRALLIYLLSGGISYLIAYRFNNIRLAKAYCVVCLVAPFVVFVPLLLSESASSFFEQIQDFVLGKTGNADFANDTRTFLYLEMAEDLNRTGSWLWGKGAYAHYYSYWFDEGGVGRYGRISSEVPILNYLLHGGIAYVVVYLGILVYAIYNALQKGNSRFTTCCAMLIASWFFYSFVCDVTGCRFYHMVFYMLVGCCLSKRWLNYSDEDVELLLK